MKENALHILEAKKIRHICSNERKCVTYVRIKENALHMFESMKGVTHVRIKENELHMKMR